LEGQYMATLSQFRGRRGAPTGRPEGLQLRGEGARDYRNFE
jgi:hypothetical protein